MSLKKLSNVSKSRPKSLTTSLANRITLETYLTDPNFFGLTTATPVQRAKCRIIEGLPLGHLAKDPNVLDMCGGKPPPAGARPFELLDISAIRIGKSLFAAAVALWLSQTVSVEGLRPSDIVKVFVVALSLKNTRAVIEHFMVPMVEQPALRALLADDPKEITVTSIERSGLRVKHPSGRIIEITPVPLDRAGGSGVSVYSAGIIVDEYPRMAGADDGIKNIDHFREAVLGRMLPGAVFLATGSPWQPYGPAYDAVVEHFGKPTRELVVLRTSAKPFIGIVPSWTTRDGIDPVERLRKQSPIAYKTDFLAEFADGEEAVFPATAIEEAYARPATENADFGRPAIFADPSALRHDYWAAMVAGWVHPVARPEELFEVEHLGEEIRQSNKRGQVVLGDKGWIRILEDSRGRPIPRKERTALRPIFEVYDVVSWDKSSGARGLDLVKAVGQLGRQYGCTEFHWDGYEQLMLADLVRSENLRPHVHTWSGAGRKTEAVDLLRTLFVERRVKLPAGIEKGMALKNELLRFRAKATPGGNFQYVVAGGSGHGDHASCLTLAMRADLDGYVDRSPTKPSISRTEIRDYAEEIYLPDW